MRLPRRSTNRLKRSLKPRRLAPGPGPGQSQPQASPRDADIEEPAFFFNRVGSPGVAVGQESFRDAHDVDRVPLETLGAVQRGECHGRHGRLVLTGLALDEFGDKLFEGRADRYVDQDRFNRPAIGRGPRPTTTLATLAGAAFLYAVTTLVQ